MPCYQINLIAVVFKVENIELLEKAAKSMGLTFQKVTDDFYRIGSMDYDVRAERIKTYNQSDVNRLKREYSKQVINKSAKKYSWLMNKKSENKFQAVKY